MMMDLPYSFPAAARTITGRWSNAFSMIRDGDESGDFQLSAPSDADFSSAPRRLPARRKSCPLFPKIRMAEGKDAMRFGLYLPCVGSNPVPGSAKEPGNRFTHDLALTDIQFESAQPRKPDGKHMEGMRALAAQKILVEALSLEFG